MTQNDRILDRLKRGDRLTIRGIFVDMNVNSPSKRLSEIKAMGWPLCKETVYINKSHHDVFFLDGQIEMFA